MIADTKQKAAITITGYESNYEGDDKGWVKTPTRLQILEDHEIPGMENHMFTYAYKKQGNKKYTPKFSVHMYDSTIIFDRFQDVYGISTEITRIGHNNKHVRIGIKPQRNGYYILFVARNYSLDEFNITKAQFTKAEKYLRSIKDVVA